MTSKTQEMNYEEQDTVDMLLSVRSPRIGRAFKLSILSKIKRCETPHTSTTDHPSSPLFTDSPSSELSTSTASSCAPAGLAPESE